MYASRLQETSYEEACGWWPDLKYVLTFLGWKNHRMEFTLFWNGNIGTGFSVGGQPGRPGGDADLEIYLPTQLHCSFATGTVPVYHNRVTDDGSIPQRLLRGYLPVVQTTLEHEGLIFEETAFAGLLEGAKVVTGNEDLICHVRWTIRNPTTEPRRTALWANLAARHYAPIFTYAVAFPDQPTVKVEDVAPRYTAPLARDGEFILDDAHCIRLAVPGVEGWQFFDKFNPDARADPALADLEQKRLLENVVRWDVTLAPGQEKSLDLKVPFFPLSAEKGQRLATVSFDSALEQTILFWENELAQGMQIETPEALVNEVYKAALPHIFITTDMDPKSGLLITKTSPLVYESVWANLSASVIINGLDLRGHHQDAAAYLEPFIVWQGKNQPPGEYSSNDGYLGTPPEWTPIAWASNNGWLLWALASHYLCTRDEVYLQRALPHIMASCDWIIRERTTTMQFDARGQRVLHYGLLPRGVSSDVAVHGYFFTNDAYNYLGLATTGRVLAQIGHPRAEAILQAAASYRSDSRSSLERATAASSKISLKDGQEVPFVPLEAYQRTSEPTPELTYVQEGFEYHAVKFYLDIGPLHLVETGILDADEPLVDWMLRFVGQDGPYYQMLDLQGVTARSPACLYHGVSTFEPFYAPHAAIYYQRDDVDRYLETFYGLLAAGMSRKTYTMVETREGIWHLPWADAEFTKFLRWMLVKEEGDVLRLAWATPRVWLEHGRSLSVTRAPSLYGPLDFRITSQVGEGIIEANICPPRRNPPKRLILRLRHPAALSISRVTVNGQEWQDFTAESVILPGAGDDQWEIEAQY